MNSNLNISEKYLDLLKENEKPIWIKEGKPPEKVSPFSQSVVYIIFIVIFGLVFINNPMGFSIPVFLFGLFMFAILYQFINIDNSISYLASDERILFIKNKKIFKSYSYKNIYDIDFYTDKLVMKYSSSGAPWVSSGEIPTIPNVENMSEVRPLIRDHWIKKSRHHVNIEAFEEIVKKYDLEFDEEKAKNKLCIDIKGDINGMPLEFKLNNFLRIDRVFVKIECPNAEKNSLFIGLEQGVHKIGKLLGNQDIIVGHRNFDQKYLLQSNNETFFHSIMDDNIVQQISTANRYLEGSIVIREKNQKKKNVKKGMEDILDDVIFEADDNEKVDGHISDLRFELLHNPYGITNTQLAIKKSLEIMELMINMAVRIQEYDKVGK